MTKFRLGNTRASKLTAAQVVNMRREWADGAKQKDLAQKYGVTSTTVYNIIYGLTWQSLPAAVPDEQIMFEAEQSLNRLDTALEITDPSDVGLTPEEIEKLSKQLTSGPIETEERVDVTELLKRRSERGQPNDQGINEAAGGVRTPTQSSTTERSIHGGSSNPVGTGPLPEAGGDTDKTGEDA